MNCFYFFLEYIERQLKTDRVLILTVYLTVLLDERENRFRGNEWYTICAMKGIIKMN